MYEEIIRHLMKWEIVAMVFWIFLFLVLPSVVYTFISRKEKKKKKKEKTQEKVEQPNRNTRRKSLGMGDRWCPLLLCLLWYQSFQISLAPRGYGKPKLRHLHRRI